MRLNRPALEDILQRDGRPFSEVVRDHKIPTSTAYAIRSGDGATPENAQRLADAFGVDVRTLFPELWIREIEAEDAA